MEMLNDVPRFEPGDIYFYNNPYTKKDIDSKINVLAGDRPVLIISARSSSCMVIPLTTKSKEINQINLINKNEHSSLDAVEYMSPRKITEVRNSTLTNFLGSIDGEKFRNVLQLYPVMINSDVSSVTIEAFIRSIRANLIISINNAVYLVLSVTDDYCLAAKVVPSYNTSCSAEIVSRGLLNGMKIEGAGSMYKFKVPRRFKVIGALKSIDTNAIMSGLITNRAEVVDLDIVKEEEVADTNLLNKICKIKKNLISVDRVKIKHPFLPYMENMPQKILNGLKSTDELIQLINYSDDYFVKEKGYSLSFIDGLYTTIKTSMSNATPDSVIEALISRGVL